MLEFSYFPSYYPYSSISHIKIYARGDHDWTFSNFIKKQYTMQYVDNNKKYLLYWSGWDGVTMGWAEDADGN